MHHEISADRRTLTIFVDSKECNELHVMDDLHSDQAMMDFLLPLLANSDLLFVDGLTSDLTSAPMLGTVKERADGSLQVIERWAFTDYQVVSLLERLRDHGKVVLTS